MSGALDRRLAALAEATDVAHGRLEPEAVETADSVVRRAGERLGHGLEATVVALAGPTGAGKSTLFNALAGSELVRACVRRPTTSTATAAVWGSAETGLLDWLEVPARHVVGAGDAALDGLVLLDLPDFDSVETAHRVEVDRLVRLVDLLVWVVDPQKYADASLHERYLRPLAAHAPAMLVVLNQADRLGEHADEAARDLRGLLEREGLRDVPVLPASALTGDGLAALRAELADRVARREAALARLEADVGTAADRLAAATAQERAAGLRRGDRERLVDTLAHAAGLPAVLDAVGHAHRRRGALAAGLPWVAWLRRLRPDPLKRLRLGGDVPTEDVRTSLPRATAVQTAQVDAAARSLAVDASRGLPEPWPALARRAATAAEDRLADQLDRAIAGADLRVTRPRWWTAARWLQLALALVSVAGLLWLVALAGLGYLQLDDAVPTPEVEGFPVPTALLIGGLLAGMLVALIARQLNRIGARRRTRRARKAVEPRIAAVADELVIAPLEQELAAHDRLREALAAARGGVRKRTLVSNRARARDPAAVPG